MPSVDEKERAELLRQFNLIETEQFLEDFGCAILRDIPIHGRMYLTKNYVLFHANIFNFKAIEKIPFHSITKIEKANMALLIPNAIAIFTRDTKFVFTSFAFRDAAFRFLTLLWRVAIELPISWPGQEGTDQEGASSPAGSSRGAVSPQQQQQAAASVSPLAQTQVLTPAAKDTPANHYATAPGSITKQRSMSEEDEGGPRQEFSPTRERAETAAAELGAGPSSDPAASPSDPGSPQSPSSPTSNNQASQPSGPPPPLEPPPTPQIPFETNVSTPAGSDKTSKSISGLDTPKPFSVDTVEKMKEVVSIALSISVTEYFSLFLSDDSTWERDFHTAKGDTELEQTLWRESHDGARVRDLKYRTQLNNKIGPKSTRVHEQQVLRQVTYKQIVLETSVWTLDVPYGDSFCVISRFSITDAPEYPGCWMYVSLGTSFTKTVWIKSLIERGAFSGSKEFFALWVKLAKARIEELRSKNPVVQSLPLNSRQPPAAIVADTSGGADSAAATAESSLAQASTSSSSSSSHGGALPVTETAGGGAGSGAGGGSPKLASASSSERFLSPNSAATAASSASPIAQLISPISKRLSFSGFGGSDAASGGSSGMGSGASAGAFNLYHVIIVMLFSVIVYLMLFTSNASEPIDPARLSSSDLDRFIKNLEAMLEAAKRMRASLKG